jgi:hypothetical protein
MMRGILWPVIGLLLCLGGWCVVMWVVAGFGRRRINPDHPSTRDDDAGRER